MGGAYLEAGATRAPSELYQGLLGHGATAGYYDYTVQQPTPSEAIKPPRAPGGAFSPGRMLVGTIATFDIGTLVGAAMAEVVDQVNLSRHYPGQQTLDAIRTCRRLTSVIRTSSVSLDYTSESFPGEPLHVTVTVVPRLLEAIVSPPALLPERPQPLLEDGESGPLAYGAFKDLAGWLRIGDQEVADLIGIGRTTVYAWKRQNCEPRPKTARRLYEVHAVLAAIRRRGGTNGLDLWLGAGEPSRRLRILAGELDSLQHEVDSELFGDRLGREFAWEPADQGVLERPPAADPPRPSGRRPRRAKRR